MTGNIIHLIGFPGVGKLTIAKEIVRQRPDFVLVDNHLINNPVFSIIKADGKTKLPNEIWPQIARIRDVVLDTMVRFSPPDLSFVMTNFAIEDEEDKAEARKIENTAAQRGGLYFPVIVTCGLEENRRRIVTPERRANLKCIDPDDPGRNHAEKRLMRFDTHPNRIEIDVTHIQPADAAREILQRVHRDRVPDLTASATTFPQP